MSRVFILGATGYIGLPVALAFERSGYNVSGTARTKEKAALLLQNEIKPVICKAQDVDIWMPVAEKNDVVIEMVSDLQDKETTSILAKALIELTQRRPNILVIYTSGTWVHGDTKDKRDIVDEHVVADPFPIVGWRPTVEKLYTDAGATVLRPGLVYGRSASLTGIWFSSVGAGKISFLSSSIIGSVHVEDLADAYVRAARNAHAARGQIFNVVAHTESPALAFIAARNDINPSLQIEITEKPAVSGSLEEPMVGTQVVDSAKARIVLGWVPTHRSFTAALPRLYAAWKAHKTA